MGVHDGHRERLRRRFLQDGFNNFDSHEALELLLFYAIPRRDTNALAHRLLERYGTLTALMRAPIEEIAQEEGVGINTAILIKAVPQLFRMARMKDVDIPLNTTARQGLYLIDCFAMERCEAVYQLCLDRKGCLLSRRRVGEGGLTQTEVDVRKIVEYALLASASSVVLAHNHPSGVALPSREDYNTTDKIRVALKTVNITLLDHIIVAGEDYVSLRESGYLT